MSPTNTSALVVPKVMPDGSTVMMTKFEWTGAQSQVAVDVAEGVWRKREIADRAGVETGTVTSWMKHPEFQARVDELCAEMRERVKYIGLARVEVRVAAQYERWLALRQVIKERAEAAYECAGGSTGMLAWDQKMIGGGDSAQLVDEFKVDKVVLAELRELELLTAKELGQHVERKEITGAGGGPVQMQALILAKYLSPDQLEDIHRKMQEDLASGVIPMEPLSVQRPAEEFPA